MNSETNFIGGGLKCDNPECDFVDMSIKVEEYESWLNAPCPKCGSNLLTQGDLDTVKMIIALGKLFYAAQDDDNENDKQVAMQFNFNGTDKVEVSIEEINER